MKPLLPLEKNASSAPDPLKASRHYQECMAEREEILRHKWFESEKLGQDVGFEKALLSWVMRHRAAWRAHRRVAGSHHVEESSKG